VERIQHPDPTLITIPPDPVPPPPVPETRPKTNDPSPQPQPYVDRSVVPTESESKVVATDIKSDTVLPIDTGIGTGTGTAVEEKPAPPPPLIGAVADPRYARDFQPDYPGSEIRGGREGTVSVRVLIGVDGRVKAVEQVSATSQAFFDATRRQALAKWRFKPATRGGVPQESWKVMNVRFELSGG
jgi:protein TonB